MRPLARVACLALLASAAVAGTASAQYPGSAPPPYYGPPPSYGQPYYGRPEYAPSRPPYERRFERRVGGRCDAFTPGGRQVVCELYRPKEMGESCVCPPRFAGGPYAQGRVIP